MATYIGVNGKARKVKDIYIGVNGKARKVKKAYIGVNGKARLCYTAGGSGQIQITLSAIDEITTSVFGPDVTVTVNKGANIYDILEAANLTSTFSNDLYSDWCFGPALYYDPTEGDIDGYLYLGSSALNEGCYKWDSDIKFNDSCTINVEFAAGEPESPV